MRTETRISRFYFIDDESNEGGEGAATGRQRWRCCRERGRRDDGAYPQGMLRAGQVYARGGAGVKNCLQLFFLVVHTLLCPDARTMTAFSLA